MLTSGKRALYIDDSRVTASVQAGAQTATERKDMKQYTQEQFQALLDDENWTHTQEIETITELDRDREIFNENTQEPELVDYKVTIGSGKITSTHNTENITVIFNEGWSYDNCEPDTFSHDSDGLDNVYEHEGFTIIDEDGDEVADGYHFIDYAYCFNVIDYSEITDNIEEIELVDEGRECPPDYEDTCIQVDNGPDLAFFGLKIAECWSRTANKNDRWTELELHQTKSGLYVCSEVYKTCWQGDRDRHKAKVCKTLDEVKEFFGYGWLAKELYDKASIDYTQTID